MQWLTELFRNAIDIFFRLDVHLTEWANLLGHWLYALLFVIIFCETGLVVTPFLPGDSLLFALGALAALDGSPVNVGVAIALLITAGVLGDATNYSVGRYLGPKVFARENSRLLNRKHLLRTQEFYERHGGKTIVIARFMPIVRTFAPFVAGIGQMRYRRFAIYNVTGAAMWVSAFILAGYWFGNIPSVKRNFQFVILAIIIISVMPIGIEYLRSRRRSSSPVEKDPPLPVGAQSTHEP